MVGAAPERLFYGTMLRDAFRRLADNNQWARHHGWP